MSHTSYELRYLRFARFVFTCKATSQFRLPEQKGSTFRGGFGHVLKKTVCINKKADCNRCILVDSCIYSYIFETKSPEGSKLQKGFEKAPHPFVLIPPSQEKNLFKEGDTFTFALTLIGKAIDYLPYFVFAFQQLGSSGIGSQEGTFTIESITNEHFSQQIEIYNPFSNKLSGTLHIYASENFFHLYKYLLTSNLDELQIHIVTPLRIKTEGSLTDDFTFFDFMRLLMNRLYTLTYFHCGNVFDRDHRDLLELSKSVKTVDKYLQWKDWTRYSNRQQSEMKIGGVVGSFTLKGELKPFIPFLKIGEYVHIGKLTSMGLGGYRISIDITGCPN
ncbi:MAG: CRISPR system precrRNA processing endoribonuclease RAMP protein Cas6 [Thermodesulfovibrionales bacterium]|nr:CRISPR system precrRNA processing endoribonuclease RAMP protein Cas6 [Thermodesulfovibrionales bacterium]